MVGKQRRCCSTAGQPALPALRGLQHGSLRTGGKIKAEQVVDRELERERDAVIAGHHAVAEIKVLAGADAIGDAARIGAHLHAQGVGGMQFVADVHVAVSKRCRDLHLGQFYAGRCRTLRHFPEVVVKRGVATAHPAISAGAGRRDPGGAPQVTMPGATTEDIPPAKPGNPPLHLCALPGLIVGDGHIAKVRRHPHISRFTPVSQRLLRVEFLRGIKIHREIDTGKTIGGALAGQDKAIPGDRSGVDKPVVGRVVMIGAKHGGNQLLRRRQRRTRKQQLHAHTGNRCKKKGRQLKKNQRSHGVRSPMANNDKCPALNARATRPLQRCNCSGRRARPMRPQVLASNTIVTTPL